jgi:outer membrane protein assembly factor BamA
VSQSAFHPRPRAGRLAAVLCGVLLVLPPPAHAQEADTRAERLRQQREAKSEQLEPPRIGTAERLLLALENGRLFERLLNPAEGWYPKIGNVTAGSGFSFGPGYRHPGLFGGHADASAFAAASFKQYWMFEGRLRMPRLAGERVVLDLHAQRYEFPEEDFFGLGPQSLRENDVTYGLKNTVLGVTAGYTPTRWLAVTGTVDRLDPRISAPREGSIRELFSDADAPGLDLQPDFVRYEAAVDLNHREPRGNPRRGGQYTLRYQSYDDDLDRFSFDRVEVDLQHYVPFLNERRVIAVRAMAATSDARDGSRVPFYLQETLGGPDDLRGFRRFRFRDEHMILLQAEYRWEIFTAVDGALFYDAGKVASRAEDIDFRNLESDYGIGFRFGTRNGVFLRVEGAFGSSGGKHFIMRFGHVF